MGIAKVGAKLFGLFAKNSGKGKLLGTSKNGIQVFRKTSKDGTIVTKSYKDGKLYKSISKTPLNENKMATYNPHINTGHKTVVKNAETGVTTNIKKVDADYKRRFSQYNTYFDPGVRNEFFVSQIGADGKAIYSYNRITSPDFFIGESISKLKNGVPYYESSTYKVKDITDRFLTLNNYRMPNGVSVTGEFGRRTYFDPISNQIKHKSLLGRGHEIAITQNNKGETIVKSGYNAIS